jgi:hypothetical protein
MDAVIVLLEFSFVEQNSNQLLSELNQFKNKLASLLAGHKFPPVGLELIVT